MKKHLFLFPLVFIVILAYCRYTYMLNPNFSGEDMLVKIAQDDPLVNQGAHSPINIKSIIVYWVLFFLSNAAFFLSIFPKGKVKLLLVLYLLISALSMFFFAMNAFLIKSPAFFMMASSLKNFLLTPVFTASGYLLIRYFGRYKY